MLQTASQFFKESYKLINVWGKFLKENSKPLTGLGTLGNTRWWSKAKAFKKIFGSSKSSLSDDVTVLTEVFVAQNHSQIFNAKDQKHAKSLIEFSQHKV